MIDIAVLPERHRVLVRLEGEVTGPEFVSALTKLLQRDPALHHHDFLFDLRRYEGTVAHDDLAAFATWLDDRFGTTDRGGATTCLVSGDRGYRFWAPLLEKQFRKRTFRWVPDMASAEAVFAASSRCANA